jgi:hypothetical protein
MNESPVLERVHLSFRNDGRTLVVGREGAPQIRSFCATDQDAMGGSRNFLLEHSALN